VNQSVRCEAGACAFTCAAGFADCDGNPGNGCEAGRAPPAARCPRACVRPRRTARAAACRRAAARRPWSAPGAA
jgi:hypothetical protein